MASLSRQIIVRSGFGVLLAILACGCVHTQIANLQDFGKHLGEYPCLRGWLKAPALQAELQRILGAEFEEYREHIEASGCGRIERRGPYVLLDVSQLHVGGYTSIILIRESDEALSLMWLKTTVAERKIQIYSRNPVKDSALQEFSRAMNITWGHVACFVPEGRSLRIDTTHRGSEDGRDCTGRLRPNQPLSPTSGGHEGIQ